MELRSLKELRSEIQVVRKSTSNLQEDDLKRRFGLSSEEESKLDAFFGLNIYGDLQFNEPNLRPANFYELGVWKDNKFCPDCLALGLQIGHESANSNEAGEGNVISPSSCSHDDAEDINGLAATSTTPYSSARIQSLIDLKTKYVTAPVAFDIEASKATWTQTASDPNNDANDADIEAESDYDDDDDCSDDGIDVGASNRKEFDRLKEHPEWGSFFKNYSDLKLGALLATGGQAKVYKATGKRIDFKDSTESFVVKVFEEGFRLRHLQKWWPKGLVEAANSHFYKLSVPYVCWALGAQLLEDNRFAFVFPQLKCDLRKRIDDAMLERNGKGPPFSPFKCFCIISDIAAGMAYLHNRNMLHHDLKAANVLDRENVCEDQRSIMMLIADFESSVGINGTGFWRAPEILSQVRAQTNSFRKAIKFTKEADVYSFAMTCYEVITGRLPFEDRSATDVDGVIDRGERPELPPNINPELRDLICRCWNSDPLQRPSFDTIRTELIELGKTQSKAWNVNLRFKKLDLHRADPVPKKTKRVKHKGWEWPIYDLWRSLRGEERRLREETKEGKPDDAPFEVTYEQDGPMPDTVTVKLLSPDLIQIAKQCLPTHEQFSIDKPMIDAKDMFVALQSFRDAHQSIQQDVQASRAQYWHLKHLLRFLETHFKDTTAQVERMRREKKVTFDLHWAFFYKGEKVHYTCYKTGQTLQGVVKLAYYHKSGDEIKFKVRLESRDYNGSKYVTGSEIYTVGEFKGEVSWALFQNIMFPMRHLEESRVAEMEAMFLRNGRKFYNIVTQGSTYMHYEGSRLRYERVGNDYRLKKQKADGRVMVDLLSFARTNPEYRLDNAEPPTKRNTQIVGCGDQEMPSDEELMLAPAIVYGFSFANKQWGAFDINGFSEIHFDDQAFDRDLVLSDPERKEMLLALVTQYVKDPSADDMVPRIDPISNKGDGCIFLCYGPPGTGKTLTAESIAEKLHRPLWSMSVFELGVTAKDLETNMMEILDIAAQWRAVLLLDEADLYLEKRTSNADPNRTAMTAIFLRLLEYYRGVLFLTTNRVASFDDAFGSRISMFLRYQRLSGKQREMVWGNLLSRAQIQNPDLTLFADCELNGREIRNCIRIAQAWARSSGEELTTNHVLRVVHLPEESRQDLEEAVTEETDEQSITRVLGRVQYMNETNNVKSAHLSYS